MVWDAYAWRTEEWDAAYIKFDWASSIKTMTWPIGCMQGRVFQPSCSKKHTNKS